MNSMKEAMTEALQHPITEEPRTRSKTKRRQPKVTRSAGQQPATISASTFLWSALGSMGASLALRLMGKPSAANFVGQVAPAFLVLGMYNKLCKLAPKQP